MQHKKALYFIFFVSSTLMSCVSESKKSYAIRDFKSSLQPLLTEAVSTGIVSYFEDSVLKILTDTELIQLSKSEHPILRALAFRAMLNSRSFNHFDIIMNNLEDTAIVATNAGEFGISYSTISDDIIENGRWRDTMSKNKTIEVLLTKHNYLKSAYTALLYLDPQEKYYPYIKKMVNEEKNFSIIEYSLFGLAKFKKAEDIKLITQLLLSHASQINYLSLRLMEEYPNNAYIDIYKKYYRRKFGHSISNDHLYTDAPSFFSSLASYKNNESASLLDTILNKKPFLGVNGEADHLKRDLIYAIWHNRCEAYAELVDQIEDSIKKYEKNSFFLPPETVTIEADTSYEPIRW